MPSKMRTKTYVLFVCKYEGVRVYPSFCHHKIQNFQASIVSLHNKNAGDTVLSGNHNAVREIWDTRHNPQIEKPDICILFCM